MKATASDFEVLILKLSRAFSHLVDKDHVKTLAASLAEHGKWTKAEIDIAEALILTDPKLSKEVAFSRAVGPAVFAQAKEHKDMAYGRPWRYDDAWEWIRKHYPEETTRPTFSELFEPVIVEGLEQKFFVRR